MDRPVGALDGVRILDFASVGPAARASRMLSDYGADVVKIGPMPRDGGVQIVPPHYAYSGHRGMRRMSADLKSDRGRAAVLALAVDSDVVLESFRPGVMERLGFGYDDVRAVNDRIVYCSTSGFGRTGPKHQWAGHDINYLALSGYLDCSTPSADGTPPLPGATVADIAAGGMQATMAIMAGLLRRDRTGTGEHLDVSIADGAFALMSLYVDEYLATGTEPGPGHYILTGRYACYDTYRCGDGGSIAVGAIEPAFWRNLCEAIGRPDLVDAQMDDNRQAELRAVLTETFASRTRDEWADLLGPADCCVSPVLSVAEATRDPQFAERGLITEADHAEAGPFRQTGPVWAGTTPPDGPYVIRDGAVTDTAELMASAGWDRDAISAALDEGAIA